MSGRLTTFIERDLKARILSGKDLPRSLSLTHLSAHYGVSNTPVRKAVDSLVDQQFIHRMPNRRLRINTARIGEAAEPAEIEQPVPPTDWAEVLLDEVMRASLSRKEVYLREGLLAERYDVGRSIIRQIFSQFAGAGLLDHVARRGWLVHPLNEKDTEAYLEIRELLELRALAIIRDRIVDAEVREILEHGSDARDEALHRYLVEASGNRYIREFFRQYVARYYMKLFHYAAPETSIVDDMTDQHKFILQAILDRDWARAQNALASHIRFQKTVLRRLMTDSTQPTA